ncbi:MAG TPA: hypothetical protein VLA09_01180, partial [Longimicrobiales bacterium]|nr:hypothetical protein [Longimicrobiales bacterium]
PFRPPKPRREELVEVLEEWYRSGEESNVSGAARKWLARYGSYEQDVMNESIKQFKNLWRSLKKQAEAEPKQFSEE